MTTYNELKGDFDKLVEDLQSNCKHEDVSDWMDECYAVAHPTGWQVKMCNICDKMVARKTKCADCDKELIEGVDVIKIVSSLSYCEKCVPKAEAEKEDTHKFFEEAYKRLCI